MSRPFILAMAVATIGFATIAIAGIAKAANCEDMNGSRAGTLEISGAPGLYAKLELKCGGVVLNSCKAIVGPQSGLENGDASCTFPATDLTSGEYECLTTAASFAGPGSTILGSCDPP